MKHFVRRLRMKLISLEAAMLASLIAFFGCTWNMALDYVGYIPFIVYMCGSVVSFLIFVLLIFRIIKLAGEN